MDIRPEISLAELAAIFISYGRLGVELQAEPRGDVPGVLAIRNCGSEPWQRLACSLTTEELRDLIRGLVLYSRVVDQGIGGSVSPVIVLYRVLVDRAPIWEPELTSWIIANRCNRWEPFGTLNDGGATSLKEFLAYVEANAKASAERYRVGMLRLAADQSAKRQRDRDEATQRIAAAVRRGDLVAVQSLLRKNPDLKAALPNGASLVDLALACDQPEIANIIRAHHPQ